MSSYPLPPDREDVFRTLLSSMPDIIYAKDLASRFILCNNALAQLVGAPDSESLFGKTDAELFPKHLAARYLKDEREIFDTGEPIINQLEPTVGRDGVERWDSSTKIPILDEQGLICGLVGITRDITEQKRASELLEQTNAALHSVNEQLKDAQFQLIQFEKSQSLSRLAAGLAHEIKNPLAVLEMGLSFIADEIIDGTSKTVLTEMHTAISRANQVIADVMQLAADQKLDRTEQSLNEIIRAALLDLQPRLIEAGITTALELDSQLGLIPLDRNLILRVLKNVLTNSLQAMPNGGKLAVRSILTTLTADDVSHDSGNRSGRFFRAGERIAIVEIEDNGIGIAEEKRSAVFDAFYTSKPTGNAIGLGLTVSRKIMELHGGTIEIRNAAEQGTVVELGLKL